MECHCIPAVELPHTTRLYSTYIQDFHSVAEFYAHPPTIDAVRQVAGELRFDAGLRHQVAQVLRAQNRQFGADASVESSLDRFEAGAAAIVGGNQVGLFSGPSFSIYKPLTTLRLADDLTAAGTQAVGVFWLATEDHDLAEVNHCFWPARSGTERLDLPQEGSAGRRVGEVPLGEPIKVLVQRAVAALEGPAAGQVARSLTESYRAAETYGSAFGKLLARIFAGRGLIFLDPLAPELHRLAAPLYRSALEKRAELGRELVARSTALVRAKYHAQVNVTDRNALLFVSVNDERLPLRARNNEFVLGRRSVSLPKLLEMLSDSPENFSPNVLLRPILQDTLLPTAAYVAGPAEVAYFAQASVVYQRLLGRMPVIIPRMGITLVDSHAARLLRKYGLEFTDLLRGPQHLRSKMERDLLPRQLTRRFQTGEKALRKLLGELREPIAKMDPTLTGSLENAEAKMLYQLNNLQGKVSHAVSFRSSVLEAHQRELTDLLYPNGGLQERSLCFLPTLALYGSGVLDELSRRISPGGTQHQVLYL